MNGGEILRMIDAIHREKGIDKEILFQALESALATAARKRLGGELEDLEVRIDRHSGDMEIESEEYEISPDILPDLFGRIAAQTTRQMFFQKIREAEQSGVFQEFSMKIGEIVVGRVSKFEGETIIVDLQKTEGIIPRDQRVRGETYRPGDTIRALIWDVKKVGHRVRIILSRKSEDLVARLFEIEVPEIAEGIIDIKQVVRDAGYRTKIAVMSSDAKVDCVGACVGVRGSRIKSIIDELNGEKIDIIRWSDSLEHLVMNALKPAQIELDNIYPEDDGDEEAFQDENHRPRVLVIVDEDQQSLAIGKGGRNVRLASRLCMWEIDIKTRRDLEQPQDEGASEEDTSPSEEEAAATPESAPEVAEPAATTDGDTPASQAAEAPITPDPPEATGGVAEDPLAEGTKPSAEPSSDPPEPEPAGTEPESTGAESEDSDAVPAEASDGDTTRETT